MTGTGIIGRADGYRDIENLTPETLRELLLSAHEIVIVENPAQGPDFYAQAARQDGEGWQVEVRGGGPDRHVSTQAANTDAVFDILRSWAAGDGWWQEAFSWERVDQRRPT